MPPMLKKSESNFIHFVTLDEPLEKIPSQETQSKQPPQIPQSQLTAEQIKSKLVEAISRNADAKEAYKDSNFDNLAAGILANVAKGKDAQLAIEGVAKVLVSFAPDVRKANEGFDVFSGRAQENTGSKAVEFLSKDAGVAQMFAFNPEGMSDMLSHVKEDYLFDHLARTLQNENISASYFSENNAKIIQVLELLLDKKPSLLGTLGEYNSEFAQLMVQNPPAFIELVNSFDENIQAYYAAKFAIGNKAAKNLYLTDCQQYIQIFQKLFNTSDKLAEKPDITADQVLALTNLLEKKPALMDEIFSDAQPKNSAAFKALEQLASLGGARAASAFYFLHEDGAFARLFDSNKETAAKTICAILENAVPKNCYYVMKFIEEHSFVFEAVLSEKDLSKSNLIAALNKLATLDEQEPRHGLDLIGNETVFKQLLSDVPHWIGNINDLTAACGNAAPQILKYLDDHPDVTTEAMRQPNIKESGIYSGFSNLSQLSESQVYVGLVLLDNEVAKAAFLKEPGKTIGKFVELSKILGPLEARGIDKFTISGAVNSPDGQRTFLDFCDGKTDIQKLELQLFANNSFAAEVGRYIDEMHGEPADMQGHQPKREEYITALSQVEVLGLLCADPQLFYPSTNHHLFDRLIELAGSNSLAGQFEKYGLYSTEQGRDILFRAINYDRLYGGSKSLVESNEEYRKFFKTLTEPLNTDKFDEKYYYLFANSVSNLTKAGLGKELLEIINGRISSQKLDNETRYAMEGIADMLKNPASKFFEDIRFDRNKYLGADGKLLIVEVFDQQDMEPHWNLTKNRFKEFIGHAREENGVVFLENADEKMAMFMGSIEENQDFVKKMLAENKDMILVYRGHIFNQEKTIPYNSFGDAKRNVLDVLGGCGSAGSVAGYIMGNPNTDFLTITYTSTGRGEVTNTNVEAIINESRLQQKEAKRVKSSGTPELRTLREIIDSQEKAIAEAGGELGTVKTSSVGERLLTYVAQKELEEKAKNQPQDQNQGQH